ncbi:hypothetical protein QTP88_024875 [Uroleucon formosanum]
MFARIHQALRDRGTFRRSLREGVHNADLEREILDEVNRDPETSTRALAHQFGVHHTTVWRIINREGLYPYHFLRVHGLENIDHQQRVQFCRWLLHNEVEDSAIEMRRAVTAGETGSQVRERARACLRQNGGHFE